MKYWFVATYKFNEIKKAEINLSNQNFDFYVPKILVKKINSTLVEEVLFPGYIFVKSKIEDYSSIKYTKGIKKIIKFGDSIPCLTDNKMKEIKSVEKLSKLRPVSAEIKIGQEAIISKGPFRGTIVKICSLPSKDRVRVLLTILGSSRKINFLKKDLIY